MPVLRRYSSYGDSLCVETGNPLAKSAPDNTNSYENSLQYPLFVFTARAQIHAPGPGFRLLGRNDDEKGRRILIPLCGLWQASVILSEA